MNWMIDTEWLFLSQMIQYIWHIRLWVMTCPTGDSTAVIEQMQEKARSWIDCAKNAKLSRRNFWFLVDRQFWPKVSFGLCCNMAQLD